MKKETWGQRKASVGEMHWTFFFPFPNDRTKEKVSFPHFHIVFIDLPLSTPLRLAPPLPFEAFSAKPFTIHCCHVTVCPVILPPSSLEAHSLLLGTLLSWPLCRLTRT